MLVFLLLNLGVWSVLWKHSPYHTEAHNKFFFCFVISLPPWLILCDFSLHNYIWKPFRETSIYAIYQGTLGHSSTVDWSLLKKWNWCVWADPRFKKKKEKKCMRGMDLWTFPKNSRKWGKCHHHFQYSFSLLKIWPKTTFSSEIMTQLHSIFIQL